MTDILSYALTTVADVKESLGISSGDTSKDNLIKRKINAATDYIEKYCQRRFALTTYTDIEYDASGTNTLVLRQRPVTEFVSLSRNNTSQNTDSWEVSDSEEYFVDLSAGVLELNYRASGGWDQYRVTYTAGYSTIPSDLAEACVTLACYYIENPASGTSVKRKREGQREVEYFQSGASGNSGSLIDDLGLDEVLAPYINYAISDL
jgi:hypothetical protein